MFQKFRKKYRGNRKQNCEIHEHNTRNKYDLHTESRNTSLLQKSVLHMGVRLHKHLPLKMKKLDNFNRFSKEVKSTLLKNSFYMLEEILRAKLVQRYCWLLTISGVDLSSHIAIIQISYRFQFDRLDVKNKGLPI